MIIAQRATLWGLRHSSSPGKLIQCQVPLYCSIAQLVLCQPLACTANVDFHIGIHISIPGAVSHHWSSCLPFKLSKYFNQSRLIIPHSFPMKLSVWLTLPLVHLALGANRVAIDKKSCCKSMVRERNKIISSTPLFSLTTCHDITDYLALSHIKPAICTVKCGHTLRLP